MATGLVLSAGVHGVSAETTDAGATDQTEGIGTLDQVGAGQTEGTGTSDQVSSDQTEGTDTEAAASPAANGTATEASGTDLSDWVSHDEADGVTMTVSGAANYRTSGASKAIPGFDVIDYGQEDYVFGSSTADARHWDKVVRTVLEEIADPLASLFNADNA